MEYGARYSKFGAAWSPQESRIHTFTYQSSTQQSQNNLNFNNCRVVSVAGLMFCGVAHLS